MSTKKKPEKCNHIIKFEEGEDWGSLEYSESEKNTMPDSFCSVRFEYCPRCGVKLIWEVEKR